MSYSVVDIADLEGEGPGGMVRKVRRAVGGKAFGFNYFVLPPHTDGRRHDHAGEGLEEVYFVVRGAGRMLVDDEEVELRPGTFVRVDADSVREPIAGPEGLEFVAFGAPVSGEYRPPSWG